MSKKQDHLLAAAESLVAVLLLTVVEVDVELTQFILDSADEATGGTDAGIPLLDKMELARNLLVGGNGWHKRLQGERDQNCTRVRRPTQWFCCRGIRVPMNDVPHLP